MKVRLQIPNRHNPNVSDPEWRIYESDFVPRVGDYVDAPYEDGTVELEVGSVSWVPEPDDATYEPYVLVVLKP